jgi:hypothetical protein
MKRVILFLSFVIYSNLSFGQDYIFFLHNRFVESNPLDAIHPEYGKCEYYEIINEFKKENFKVLSEKREVNTNVKEYANKIVSQIDSLLKKDIKPNNITVIGTSKGGYIAQYVSTYLKNSDVNFIFIGCFKETDLVNYPEINFCGNILNIYEKSDEYGSSTKKRKNTSKYKISNFKEIALNTGLKHGFLFKPLQEWIKPCVKWARRNYK